MNITFAPSLKVGILVPSIDPKIIGSLAFSWLIPAAYSGLAYPVLAMGFGRWAPIEDSPGVTVTVVSTNG